MRLRSFLAVPVCLAATFAAAQSPQWNYQGRTGPLNWGRLDPAYKACSDGRQQSPIDIRGAHLNKGLQPLEFHYRSGSATMVNTGTGIDLAVHKGSYMVANGVRYELQKVSFHHPGEISVKGVLTDMDAQLFHRSADGKIAVVTVRLNLDESHPNPTLAALWEHLPDAAGKSDEIKDMVNAAGLLPGNRGYWTFTGSLSTPPCTEGAEWFVMEQNVGLNRAQLQSFASLYKLNSRPLQERNGRRIEASQ